MGSTVQHTPAPETAPLRLLSLDGGGVRGLAMLVMLKRIMDALRDKLNLLETPKPCEYFDLIGGTSTGGVIALMLGPLRMGIEECINAFKQLSSEIFHDRPNAPNRFMKAVRKRSFFDHNDFENAVKRLLSSRGLDADELLRRGEEERPPRVFVLATRIQSAQPTLLRTYRTRSSTEARHNCPLWEAARATTAAPLFFEPVTLRGSGLTFVDGALGVPNPSQEVLTEATKRLWPGRRVGCLISLGTGRAEIQSLSTSASRLDRVIKCCVDLAFNANRRHEDFQRNDIGNLFSTGRYYRFDVQRRLGKIVLDEASQHADIEALADEYLNSGEVGAKVDSCASVLAGGAQTEGLGANLAGLSVDDSSIALSPTSSTVFERGGQQLISHLELRSETVSTLPRFNNDDFTGRAQELLQLHNILSGARNKEADQRVALWGLGGVGKSQIALKYAQQTRERSTFWVRAGTIDSIEEGYTTIAMQLVRDFKPPNNLVELLCLVRDVLEHASVHDWLLILDEADDMEVFVSKRQQLTMEDYIPRCPHGQVIFTTRNHALVGLADGQILSPKNEVEITHMTMDDSVSLFKGKLRDRDLRNETPEQFLEFVKMLGCLPLAIIQAASYIRNHGGTSLEDFEALYRKTERWLEVFENGARTPDDQKRQKSVLTTWEISYQAIAQCPHSEGENTVGKGAAATTLDLLAFIDAKMTEFRHLSDAEMALHDNPEDDEDRVWLRNELGPQKMPRDVVTDVLLEKALSRTSILDGIARLEDFALINTSDCWVHPVVHDWSYSRLKPAERHQLFCWTTSYFLSQVDDLEPLQGSWWGHLNPLHDRKFCRYRNNWIVRNCHKAITLAMQPTEIKYRHEHKTNIPGLPLLMYRMAEENFYLRRFDDAATNLDWTLAECNAAGDDPILAIRTRLLQSKTAAALGETDNQDLIAKIRGLEQHVSSELQSYAVERSDQMTCAVLSDLHQQTKLWLVECLLQTSQEEGVGFALNMIQANPITDLRHYHGSKSLIVVRLITAGHLVKERTRSARIKAWNLLQETLNLVQYLAKDIEYKEDEVMWLLPALVYTIGVQAAIHDEDRHAMCRLLVQYERRQKGWREFRLFGGAPGDWFSFLDRLRDEGQWEAIVAFARIYVLPRHPISQIMMERSNTEVPLHQAQEVIRNWIEMHQRFAEAATCCGLLEDVEEQYGIAFTLCLFLSPELHGALIFVDLLEKWVATLVSMPSRTAVQESNLQGLLKNYFGPNRFVAAQVGSQRPRRDSFF